VVDDDKEPSDTSLRSLRLLLILEEVARIGVPVTPTEVNRTIGLPKQTLHRMFASLEGQGFLQREHDGRTYAPGRRLRAMATGVVASIWNSAARVAIMSSLADDIGETCNLAIPDRNGMLYVDRVETKWPLQIRLQVGSKVPLHCTASGKLFLSTLSKAQLRRVLANLKLEKLTSKTMTDPKAITNEIDYIRTKGYSWDNEEMVEGMIALAVPIKDERGRFVSSLSFHAPTQRLTFASAHQYLDRLHAAAFELSQILVEESEKMAEQRESGT
jgi:DNA-binding IclR family transcriptional regulator